jgi:RsiW-degrading membrane proteinase PrsW (M82 family)
MIFLYAVLQEFRPLYICTDVYRSGHGNTKAIYNNGGGTLPPLPPSPLGGGEGVFYVFIRVYFILVVFFMVLTYFYKKFLSFEPTPKKGVVVLVKTS